MVNNVYEFRSKGGESEKITINIGHIDLGQIDLLVREGFYSNRTDFIRTAIRNPDFYSDTIAVQNPNPDGYLCSLGEPAIEP